MILIIQRRQITFKILHGHDLKISDKHLSSTAELMWGFYTANLYWNERLEFARGILIQFRSLNFSLKYDILYRDTLFSFFKIESEIEVCDVVFF